MSKAYTDNVSNPLPSAYEVDHKVPSTLSEKGEKFILPSSDTKPVLRKRILPSVKPTETKSFPDELNYAKV